MTIRAAIVDDEPLARDRIRHLLRGVEDMTIAGEAGDGRTAVTMLRAVMPDLVFLDVQMPEQDGFDVLRAIPVPERPLVVFVTAYDKYAIHAFDFHALDYLLKPFSKDRFRRTLDRVRAQLLVADDGGLPRRLEALLADLGSRAGRNRLVVRSGERTLFLAMDDVDWFEAADNYVRVHAGKQVPLMRETMHRLEQTLPADRFVRIHRSTIVNLDRIREIQPWFHGEMVVILADGTKLTTGRSYRGRLDGLLKGR
ncbi:MAG: LytTR family DNA-binding domain-containing protein [Gemmatimonadales bacterium]